MYAIETAISDMLVALALFSATGCCALTPSSGCSRRSAAQLLQIASIPALAHPLAARASSLAERLATRDAKQLSKPIFNTPPGEAVYPDWLEGTWDTKFSFGGYELPSVIPRAELFAEPTIPGFQKCSIALVPDVGGSAAFAWRFVREPSVGGKSRVVEDRRFNYKTAIDASLGYSALESVLYAPKDVTKGPNRVSLVFAQGRTPNAERIELFANNRESQTLDDGTFVCSEYLRQV